MPPASAPVPILLVAVELTEGLFGFHGFTYFIFLLINQEIEEKNPQRQGTAIVHKPASDVKRGMKCFWAFHAVRPDLGT